MAFSRALPNSVLVRFICSLILWFASEQVLALGCTAASYTYTNNGTNTNYSLISGQSLKISRGIYAGNINSFPSNTTICIESGATFSPSNLNNPAGSLINYGTANLATFSYNSGALIDNYGLLKFTSGLNFNGATTIRNRSNATIITESSFTLANASLLENNGLIIAKQDFNTNSGTTINNNYRLEAEGNFNPSGVLVNYGRIYAKKFINANSDFSFNNYCTLISYEGFNNNSLFFSNWGTILVTSANGVPGGLWQNNQSFYNGDGAKVAGGSFTNNGSINGYGALVFSGETRNQGTFAGSSAANSINFYDETQTGSLLFDYYNLPATNTIRSPFARPTELDAPTTCNNTYKSFASLNACPAGGVINNQVGTVTQASGNGAAVENVSQAIGALQALNATATASNSAKIIAGGVLTLDLGQVVPADAPISISLARVDTARVRVEVSLDGVVFSSKGTFGSSGSLGTSSVNVLARLVINANPGGTQYIRLIREAGSMWVDGAEYSQTCVENRDYGDAPASYGVAAHKLAATNLYLGASVPDAETASAHSVRANGDGNDEDGPPPQAVGAAIPDFAVLQMTDMSYSTTIRTTNQTGTLAKLTGWIDFDKNGSFDTDERASVDVPTGSNNTDTTLTWPSIPTDITLGTTYVRLRFTTDATAALQATGTAPNGEVEDFILPIHMDIPPNSPSISIATASTPLACQSVVFQDDFNDLTPAGASYWGVNRVGAVPVRSWTASGGGVDTYARFTDWGLGYGTSIYFGNGDVRNVSPSLGSGFSFDTQGKLLTTLDALALRDSIDDLDAAGTINESHWGVLPVTLSRSFATTIGKNYRLYFSALRETGDFLPGIMRVDAPGGSIHFKAPGGMEGILDYAIDFTATSSNSSISFVNYGHFGPNSNGYCNVVNNAWCTVGGLDNNGKTANELSIDNVKLVEAACATGGIGGYVYQDSNLNNTYDMGTETTIPAITVKIYDEKASPSDFTDDRLVATQTSFADGHYLFQQLDANASYRVEIDLTDPDLPASLTMGTPNPFSGLVPLVNGTKTANFGLDPAGANGDKDYGDAPATYGVPQHTVSSGFYLGSNPPDSELNQAAPLNGSGDDATGIDDEDGVVMPSLTQGQTATIELPVAGVGGYLQAWFDWNGDGDFADSGEQIASNLQDNLVGDTNNTANRIAFPVSVPTTATSSATYARFRWSTTLGLDSTAAANNGEVEDYAVTISPASNMPTIIGEYRFDDCGSGGWQLDSSGHNNSVIGAAQIQIENYKNYACTAVSNPNWNIEVPHQANYALASGAVSILFYDHKGVWASARLLDKGWTADQKLSLEMKPSTDWQHGTISANLNGNMIDTGETYYTSLGNGSLNDTQWVHAVLSFGPAGMKLYINGVLKGSNSYTGGITGVQGNFRLPGVEGYFDEFYIFNQQPTDAQVSTLYSNLLANKTWDGNARTCNCSGGVSADYGDAPATYGEVSHQIVNGIYLGDNPPDAETLSKYSFNARADNYDDGAPRQTVVSGMHIPLFPVLQLTDSSYSVDFKVTNLTGMAGKLHGWIDFDKSGTFEADEATVVDVPSGSSNATATLSWASIPTDIQLGTVAMRVRVSTDVSVVTSTPTGSATDGEVEDYPIAIAMDIPPNSPSISIISGATPAACETVVFQDNFNDLTPDIFWGLDRPGSQSIRQWSRSGGGNDTYAHITASSATERSIYFGNGGVREISPSIGTGFNFDANGKLLTVIDAIALRDSMDDNTPGSTLAQNGSYADWGPEPVRLSRTFATTPGKTYRLYFKAIPEDPTADYASGIMRLNMPGGSIHFKAPGSKEGTQTYAVEFTAFDYNSTITFVNYGHVEASNNGWCDPNSVYNANPWCTVGGRTDDKPANELIIDDVVLTEAACATGSIRGRVYLDSDQDNNYDAGIEAGLSAITVSLYDENGTPGNYSDDRLVNTNSTYVNGEYYFTEVNTSRSYRLEVDTTDSDLPVHTVIGTTNPLTNRTVVANTLLDHQHFGFDLMTPSKIVGTVYLDNNTNDSFNPGIDYGIGNITVSLHTMAGILVASTQTAINGKYQFANLDHNLSYRITVDGTDIDLPPGATLGTVNPIPNISVPQNSTVTKDVGFDQAANGITGKVFLDYNLNGQLDSQSAMSNFANNMNIGLAFDKGIANAQIKAECVGAAGKLSFGPVTSDVNGQYYLATPGAVAGNYNCILQLTTLPSGYTVATQSGSGHQVLTQVVSPNAVNTYFALQQAMSYCQNNPDLAVNRFAYGQQTANAPFAGNNDVANIFAFPYNSGTAGVPNTLPSGYDHPLETDNAFKDLALANQVGSVFGLGWHPSSHSLFASAYMKAWTGFGSGGTGGIYRVDLSNPSSPVSSLYANLNQIFPATPPTVGSDPYLTGIFSSANPGYVQIADGSSAPDGSYVASGNATRDNQDGQIAAAVGKTAFGDLDVSADGKSLFVVNMANNKLYILPVRSTALMAADASLISSYSIPFAANCRVNGTKRAFGLGEFEGGVYVATQCGTEQGQIWEVPEHAIFRFDLQSKTFSTTPSLVYARSSEDSYGIDFSLITDIVFDPAGQMILTFRNALESPYGTTADNGKGSAYSVIRRACIQDKAAYRWEKENNASCGGVTTPGKDAGYGTGPSSGTFFYQEYPADNGPALRSASYGGAAQIPGFMEAAYTIAEPFEFYSVGVSWVDTGLGNPATAGQRNRAYSFYKGTGAFEYPDNRPVNGKNAAIGDLEVLCDTPSLEIGNRVWQDSDSDGVQDAGEPPVAGVKVELFANGANLASAIPLATAVTDVNGYYAFSSDMRGYLATGNNAPNDTAGANGGFNAADIQGGRASTASHKYGLLSLIPNTAYQVVIRNTSGASKQAALGTMALATAAQGSDPELDSDASVVGDHAVATVSMLGYGNHYHAVDFGFKGSSSTSLLISGKIFEDVNYGGGAGRSLSTAGAAGVLGVRVELYNSTGNFVTSTTTTNGGPYSFGSLANGTYYVRVVNNTIRSTRAGSDASERSIQTFRSDGTSAVTNEVGGRKPALVDAAANTTNQTLNTSTFVLSGGGQAQSVQPVTVSGSNITGADFGFNFSTVININDSGQGSLRQTILNANLLANSMTQPGSNYGVNTALNKEVLVFNIPASSDPQGRADICSGTTCNITVNSKLPDITAPLIIDGATQPGYTAGTPGMPRIRIAPTAGLDAIGISIAYTATDSTVRGLSITGFRTSNMNRAINVAAARAMVESNYLGVKPDGTADANGQGIMLEYADTATTVIGGSTAAKRNIISGNLYWGIAYDTGATAGTIQNNFIGTNVAGTAALGNQFGGIDLESANDTLILDNLIAGNAGDGLQIGYTNGTILTSGYTIRGNRIGVGINGEAIGNIGPGIMNYGGSSNHQIGGTAVGQANIIANNMGGGIKLAANSASVNNVISGNNLYANGNLGIDLGNNGVTVNDANDTDTGANNLLNFPLIAELSIANGNLTVKGCAPSGATVELFEADVSAGGKATPGDNKVGKSKDYGEGQIYLASFVEGGGSDTDAANCALATDTDGNNQAGMKAFSVTIPAPAALVAGDTMTATATLAGTGTSEFSPVFTYNASCSLIVTTTADTDNTANNSGSLRDAIECANSTPGLDSITFNMPNTETGFINPDGVTNNGNEYWQIALNSQLPSITEGVSIDGRTQTSNKGNTNSGNVAAAATVGADNIAIAAVAAPEVEIVGQWFGAGFDIKASNVNIYGLGMRLFDTNIRMDQANTTNILLNGLALGVNLVNGNDPGAGQRSNQHIAVNASGVGFVLTNSLLGFNDNKRGIVTGQYNNVSGVSATINGNHFIGVGMTGNTENAAIEILRTQNPNMTISGNRFVGRGTTVATDLAVEFNDYGGGNSTCITCLVENNSISGFHDGVGYFTDASLTGLVINKNRIYSNTEFAVFLGNVQNASVAQNYLYDNGKSGVLINKNAANGNIITQNHTYNNGEVGINLAGGNQIDPGGVTLNDANDMDSGPNSLLNFPILQQLVISNGNITARGCAPAGAVIEFFEADVSPGGAAVTGANRFGLSFDYGEGQFYLGSMVEGSVADADTGDCAMPTFDGHNNTGMKAFQFSVPTPASVVEGDYLTASATLANIGTSEFGPSIKIISGPPPIGAGSCAATGGSDILFIVDNSGSITELEYADFAQTIQTVGSQLLLNNPKNRIAVAHFGGPSDSLVGGGQYVYIERDFSSTAMLAPIRQFAWGGAYNSTWIADHLAGALQQMRYALDGQAATTSSYILSPLKETSRNTASPLQIVLMTDAARYLDAVPSDISMLIDPPGSGAEPDDGSVFTVYNQMKAEGVAFSVASFNADPTDIAASAAIASVGGTYTGAIEANTHDPQGSQVAPRRYVSVTAGFQLTTAQLDELVEGTAICSRSIQGRIFEDPNYGGGVGRPFGTTGTVGLAGASIEVYDASGHYVASVTSSMDGQYTLPNLPNATYYVRIVDASVISSRLGSNGSEIPVLTYRTDGSVATATQVGGNYPLLVDAGPNSGVAILNTTSFLFSGGGLTGKPAQSVQSINLSGSSVKGVDFGFNFSTVVNTNDAGQGSLRQFLLNNKLLSTDALAQVLPATLATDYPAGTETSIFMIPLAQLTNAEAIINLTSGSLNLERANTSIDGRTQVANMGSGVIVLKNSTSNGLTLMPTATASVVRDLTVSHAAGSGVVIDAADNALIQRVVSINNSQYGISLSNEALNNRVLTNTIANNTWAGIAHLGNGIGNTYSQNSIHDNGGLGIDLGVDGVTANDNLDSDTGANKLLNYPEVAAGSSISSNGTKVLAYDFDLDVPNNTHGYRVEFFRNTVVDSSKQGEGEIYLGYVDINHAGGGVLNFKGSFNANQTVPADANIAVTLTEKTSPTTLGSTSEFSGVRNGKVSVCTDLINGSGAEMTINENAAVITYLEATDENGNPITYVISGGADGNQFIVQDPAPGASLDCQMIVFRQPNIIGQRSASITKAALLPRPGDYEAPSDSGGDNTYNLDLTATVNGKAYVRSVSVGVQDINESPSIINEGQTEFLEGKTGVALNIESYDQDAGDEEGKGISYAIAGGVDRTRFNINPKSGELSFISPPDFEAPLDTGKDNIYDLEVRVMDAQGLSGVSSLKIAVTDDTQNDGINLQTKVFLQGPYMASNGLMQDNLRVLGLLPMTQPYSASPFNYMGSEQLNLDLAAVTGKDALVDWILIELRAANDPNTILARKTAFVQRDGDVVDSSTGSSALNFKLAAGDYFVSLRHRNHLGVRTASPVTLGSTAVILDFSQTTTKVFGTAARLESASLALLWAGDVNHDERLIASGISNDSGEIFKKVLKAPANLNLNSNYRLTSYLESDLNMDGDTLFIGPGNDTNILLGNVLLFPTNVSKNSNYIVVGGLAK